jgi:hypothetical protein
VRLKLQDALFRCGRCHQRYSNPLGHVCVTRLDRKARDGRTTVAPKAGLSFGTCGTCGKPLGNPFTHTCRPRPDFKRRAAKARKDAAAAKRQARPEHPPPSACRDADCARAACVAFRDRRQYGYEEGFIDGQAACPREHR